MDKVKPTKQPKINRKELGYRVRNVLGNAVLALGAMGFIKQNLSGFQEPKLWAVSVAVTGLVVYFTFKK